MWMATGRSGFETVVVKCVHSYGQKEPHSPTLPSLHLHHCSFSNPSLALPTSQFILKSFFRFSYVTVHSPTLLSLLHHRIFTYVTWQATHTSQHSSFMIVVHYTPLISLTWSIHLNLGLPNGRFLFFILISNALLGCLSNVEVCQHIIFLSLLHLSQLQ